MIKIYTIAFQRPDLISLQLSSFQKFLQDDFEFIIFNNNEDDVESKKCHQVCDDLKLQVIDVIKEQEMLVKYQAYEGNPIINNNKFTSANVSVAYALCYMWKIIQQTKGPILLLDSDIFLTHPIKLTNHLQNHAICFVRQTRSNSLNQIECEYIWSPGFVLVDMDQLLDPETLDLWCGKVREVSVDTGGQSAHYLESHPNLKAKYIVNRYTQDDPAVNFQPADYETLWLDDQVFALHYRSATDWNYRGAAYHYKKTQWLKSKL